MTIAVNVKTNQLNIVTMPWCEILHRRLFQLDMFLTEATCLCGCSSSSGRGGEDQQGWQQGETCCSDKSWQYDAAGAFMDFHPIHLIAFEHLILYSV